MMRAIEAWPELELLAPVCLPHATLAPLREFLARRHDGPCQLLATSREVQQRRRPANRDGGLDRTLVPDLPQPSYERSVATAEYRGSMDALHGALVIEYEHPRSLRSTAKRDHAVKQVCDYATGIAFQQLRRSPPAGPFAPDEEEKLAACPGIATDGDAVVFVQRVRGAWQTDEQHLDEDAVEKLSLWLRALSRKRLSPDNLIRDFGPRSEAACKVVSEMVKAIGRPSPKTEVVFAEWRRLFDIVYGEDSFGQMTAEAQHELRANYEIESGVAPSTYYSPYTPTTHC